VGLGGDMVATRPQRAPDALRDIPSPATKEFKQTHLACENQRGHYPSRTLISDITVDATGELFIYVNDAVLVLPGLKDVFYQNNSGTAKVTVTRVLADSIIWQIPLLRPRLKENEHPLRDEGETLSALSAEAEWHRHLGRNFRDHSTRLKSPICIEPCKVQPPNRAALAANADYWR
jgi:hypothetical protein